MGTRLQRLLAVAVLALPSCALAQAKIGVYGAVGAEKSGLSGQAWTAAETVGLYYGVRNLGPVALAVDGRGIFSSDTKNILVGPRVAVHLPLFPVKPYAEALGGVVYYSIASGNGGKQNVNDFDYRLVGGLDSTIFYHLDWRVVEFSYGGGVREATRPVHATNVSTGLVLRF